MLVNKGKAEMHFGEHLMIDGYGGDAEKLDSKQVIIATINWLVAGLGMQPLGDVEIHRAYPNNGIKDESGWRAFQIINESHISIHTFPLRKFIACDVYTCKPNLDVNLVSSHLQAQFGLEKLEINFIKRGRKTK